MARILRPGGNLWDWKPDPLTMSAPPRDRGTSATDVLNWVQLLSKGADMVGPIAGKMFTGGDLKDRTVEDEGDREAAKLQAEQFEASRRPGRDAFIEDRSLSNEDLPGRLAEYDKQTSSQLADRRSELIQRRFEDPSLNPYASSRIKADAQTAALSGERSQAQAVSRRLKMADYGDVQAGGFGDMITGAHKDARREAIEKILSSGRYNVDKAKRKATLAGMEASTAATKGRERRSKELHPGTFIARAREDEARVQSIKASKAQVKRTNQLFTHAAAREKRLEALQVSKVNKAKYDALTAKSNASIRKLDALAHKGLLNDQKKARLEAMKASRSRRYLAWKKFGLSKDAFEQRQTEHTDLKAHREAVLAAKAKKKAGIPLTPKERDIIAADRREQLSNERALASAAVSATMPSGGWPDGTKVIFTGEYKDGKKTYRTLEVEEAKPEAQGGEGMKPTHYFHKKSGTYRRLASAKTRQEQRKALAKEHAVETRESAAGDAAAATALRLREEEEERKKKKKTGRKYFGKSP